MASNITAESLLETISTGHLECSICSCRFKQPKILDCLHSFCLQCLQELVQHQTPDHTKLICPLCRQEMKLNGSGVNDLPNDFRLSALIDEFTMQEKLLKGQESAIKCQSCDEQNQAISRCMDCEHFLCQECQRTHERIVVLKSHKIYTLAQFQSGEITYISKLREEVPKCSKHPDQSFNIYCETCKQSICTTCSVLQHGKHSLVDLPQAVRQCKKQIGELFATADKQKTKFNTTIQETDTMRKKMDAAFTDTKKKISQKADKEVAKIRAEEKRLREETEQVYKKRVNTFEAVQASNCNELTKSKQKLDEVNQLVTQASSHEILELHNKILHNLTKLAKKQPDKVAKGLSFMDFEESDGKFIGKLITEKQTHAEVMTQTVRRPVKWELRSTSRVHVHVFKKQKNLLSPAVAALSNNTLVGIRKNRTQVFTCSISEATSAISAKQNLQTIGLNFQQVCCLAVNQDDQLIVLDQQTVRTFSNQYHLLSEFTLNPAQPTQPTCLAVDSNNLIAVGDKDRQEISLYKPDGALIKTVHTPMLDEYLTIYKQQFIYTNPSKRKLIFVSYDSKTVFSEDTTRHLEENEKPTGVCCDSNGNIYVVAVGEDSQSIGTCILHYAPDGQCLASCVIQKCIGPCGSALTPQGDLVVVGPCSINVYKKTFM